MDTHTTDNNLSSDVLQKDRNNTSKIKIVIASTLVVIIVVLSFWLWGGDSTNDDAENKDISESSLALELQEPFEYFISDPISVKLGTIPSDAEIVYHDSAIGGLSEGGYIYTMDRNGNNVTQITFENPRKWEHIAVSHDHKYVVGVEHTINIPSRLWIFDLERGTEAFLLDGILEDTGNGGVAFGPDGYIHFAAKKLGETKNAEVYKIKYDGSGLTQLTNTNDGREADVSVSYDGETVVTVKGIFADGTTQIWAMNSNGSNPRMIYQAGKNKVASAHDPEVTLNNKNIVFSGYNIDVPPNWPNAENTAHDLWIIDIDGDLSSLRRLTKPGPISMVPNLANDMVVFIDLSETANYKGASIVDLSCLECEPTRIKEGASSPKWIP